MGKSILSAGQAIRDLLVQDSGVTAITTKIFPVVAAKAELPYISIRRVALDTVQTKSGKPATYADYETVCYARTHTQSAQLAEAVREAMDQCSWRTEDMEVRTAYMVDASEHWENDAYVQLLVWRIRI